MQVDKIILGSVIDHIPAGKALLLIRLLKIDSNHSHRVALVMNAPSKKLGTKDILKLEGKILTETEAGVISLLCPNSTINVIKNSQVAQKLKSKNPPILENLIPCPNSVCINCESPTTLVLVSKDRYCCTFCERFFNSSELF